VAVTNHDEIGALACAFNQMAVALQSEIAKRFRCQELLVRTKDEFERGVEARGK
jgi:nitrate/nitrite-specific signal transduction histidine kinase